MLQLKVNFHLKAYLQTIKIKFYYNFFVALRFNEIIHNDNHDQIVREFMREINDDLQDVNLLRDNFNTQSGPGEF